MPIYVCDWFVDKKLRTDFGEEKSKSRLFASKFEDIYIYRKTWRINIQIKQHFKFKYLWCLFDEIMSGEAMTLFQIFFFQW